MSTKKEYVDFVMEVIDGVGVIRSKKMFGEYMIYIDEKPALLVCDDTVYVKMVDELFQDFIMCDQGFPYEGARKHYILDIDDQEQTRYLIQLLLPYLKIPKRRQKKFID